MKPFPLIITIGMIGMAAATLDARADRILTRDGRVIEGRVIKRESSPGGGPSVTVRMGSMEIKIPEGQIKEIIPGTEAENGLINVRYDLLGGRVAPAVAALALVASSGEQLDAVASLVMTFGDPLIDAVGAIDSILDKNLSQILTSIEGTPFSHSNDDLAATRMMLHLLLGEGEKSWLILDRLGKDYFEDHPGQRDKVAGWMNSALEDHVATQRFEKGRAVLDRLRQVHPTLAEGRATQFFLQWAWALRMEDRYEEALKIYVRYLLDTAPHIARDRIAKVLAEAELFHGRVKDQPQRVITLYESYGLIHIPQIARKRLAQLWSDQGWGHIQQAEFNAARQAFELADEFSEGSAQVDLLLVQYHERREELSADDPQGHYELGLWCLEKKLLDEAFTELSEARDLDHEQIRQGAEDFLAQVVLQRAEARLLEMMDTYREGKYGEVRAMAREFIVEDHPIGYLRQAMEIKDLALEAMRMQATERPQQAEALFQRAQRAYYAQQHEEAEQLLKTIFEHYSGTIAYERARNFHALVRENIDLERIEQGRATLNEGSPTTPTTRTGGEIRRLIDALEGKAP